MTDDPLPRDVLIAHAPEDARAELSDMADLAGWLDRTVDACRAAWPAIQIDPAELAGYIGARLPSAEPAAALRALHAVDLHLAGACSRGDPAALRALDARVARLAPGLPRGSDAAFTADVLSRVREKLLVPARDCRAKIAEYTGRSALDVWLRVVATRVAIDLLRAGEAGGGEGDALERVASPGRDPELEHIRARYREEFRAALAEAAAELSVRERNVLRQHYVDGLSLDALSELYRVHRVTLARRIRVAREKLTGHTRRILLSRFGVGRSELDSIMAVFITELDLSIRSALSPSQ